MKKKAKEKTRSAVATLSTICDVIGKIVVAVLFIPLLVFMVLGGPITSLPKPDAPIFVYYVFPVGGIGILAAAIGFLCVLCDPLLSDEEPSGKEQAHS